MSKDTGLFIKLRVDHWQNPKISRLSDGAFRTHIEMIEYSKSILSDGFIDKKTAQKFWKSRFINELQKNDISKPSLIVIEGGFLLRDFGLHQETRADIEQRRERLRENGSKGGRPPKPKENLVDNQVGSKNSEKQNLEKSRVTESQTFKTDYDLLNESSHVLNSENVTGLNQHMLKQIGILDVDMFMGELRALLGRDPLPGAVYVWCQETLAKSKAPVVAPQNYLLSAIRGSEFEVRKYFDEAG